MAELPDVTLARQITRESIIKKSYSDGSSDEKAAHDDEKNPVSHSRETDQEEEMEHYIVPASPSVPTLWRHLRFRYHQAPFTVLHQQLGVAPLALGRRVWSEGEGVRVQTAATSAGGLGILFVSGIPAMYRLGLLSFNPADDIGELFALTIAVAYFGVAFVIPLRRAPTKATWPVDFSHTFADFLRGASGKVNKHCDLRFYCFSLTFLSEAKFPLNKDLLVSAAQLPSEEARGKPEPLPAIPADVMR